MAKRMNILRLLLALALMMSLALTAVAYAQDAEATETPAEEGAPVQEIVETGVGTAGPTPEVAEATNPLVPLGINAGFLIAQIINFLILFGLLSVLLWRPLMNMLDNRSATIAKGLEDAAEAANARRNAEQEAERIRSEARAEAARIVEEARGRGEEVARGVQAEAAQEVEAMRAEARARAEEERNRQLAELRSQVVSIAVAMSQRLIGETLDEKRQSALVSDFFTRVPSDARNLQGSVEVVSAMPLTAEEQQRVQSEIGAQTVTFSVDPSILGGLVLRSTDRVVDASVRSNLSELAGRLR